MSKPSVAAIVLNYNGKDITLQAIESLLAMTYENFRVLHVDNGSTDGSFETVADAFPQVMNLRIETNRGAARGLNFGFKAAYERGFDYLMILNNDIGVEPDMLDELVAVMESDPSIGAVQPKMFYFWDRERIWSAGGILRFYVAPTRERGMGEIDRGQYDHTEEVDYVNGVALLTSRKVFEEVGYFDPTFNLAGEDADWCARMKKKGHRPVYVHRAILYHMVSYTTGSYVPRRTYWTGRSLSLFVRRYASLSGWLAFWSLTFAALKLAFLRELPKGNAKAVVEKWRGVIAGLREPMSEPPGLDDPDALP
ncbi:MAG: glycosyltransferase family 2 protein [Acidobacteriota bacterium]|nr:glycosyltransferase family 2 protein [Acidobacteriota bacterium]